MTDKPAEWMVKAATDALSWDKPTRKNVHSWVECVAQGIARHHREGCETLRQQMCPLHNAGKRPRPADTGVCLYCRINDLEQAVQELLAAAKLRKVRSGEHTETVWLIDDVDLRRLESAIAQVEALRK